MSYPIYLRQRASDCIRLAVEEAWEPSSAGLIDLAQDYAKWAELSESSRKADDAFGADNEADEGTASRGWWPWFGQARH